MGTRRLPGSRRLLGLQSLTGRFLAKHSEHIRSRPLVHRGFGGRHSFDRSNYQRYDGLIPQRHVSHRNDKARPMGLTYFKRYRMELDLSRPLAKCPPLPDGYSFVPWDDTLLAAHAEVKFHSFRFELDANVFPSLGDLEGCQRLMTEISRRDNFVIPATWLLMYFPPDHRQPEFCGTVQGLVQENLTGAVQNLGITPAHRGFGLGSRLLMKSVEGFHSVGLSRVSLEVTVQNTGALRLYQRLGFRRVKTVYKAAEVAYA